MGVQGRRNHRLLLFHDFECTVEWAKAEMEFTGGGRARAWPGNLDLGLVRYLTLASLFIHLSYLSRPLIYILLGFVGGSFVRGRTILRRSLLDD